MKRIKAACICQTLQFQLKEDMGHEYAVKMVKEEVSRYKASLERSHTKYKILKEGKGAIPADTSNVEVNYEGKLIDGTVFDSSLERGKPATFAVNKVIAGWQEVLKMMPVGSEWEIYIPQDKAYGSHETGNIPPFSTLIFKVELLGIK